MNATETLNDASRSSTRQKKAEHAALLRPWMDQWIPRLSEDAHRFRSRKRNAALIAVGVGFLAAAILVIAMMAGWLEDEGLVASLMCGAFTGVIVGLTVYLPLYLIFVLPQKRKRGRFVDELQAVIAEQDLPTAEIVRGFSGEIEPSEYRDHVISAIDPVEGTLIVNHDTVLALLDNLSKPLAQKLRGSDIFAKVGEVSELQDYAYQYAEAGFYAEAIALLSAAEVLHKAIAAGFPQVRWQVGNTVYTASAPWRAYSFRNEVSKLSKIVSQRKAAPQVLELLRAMMGRTEPTDLLEVEQDVSIEIRDRELVDKCASVASASTYGIIVATTGGLDAILTWSYLPGHAEMLKLAANGLFKKSPFVAPLIESCIRRGEEMKPSLLSMLREGDPNERFNAALALGMLRSPEASRAATEILDDSPSPLARIGSLFILARTGDKEHHQKLLPYLNDPDATVAHAAAIAVEHLAIPVADSVLERHLTSGKRPVQLRLTRHVRNHPQVGSSVRDAIADLVSDSDKDLSTAAAETLPALFSGEELVKLAEEGVEVAGAKQEVRRSWMLVFGHSRTERAVDLLLEEWKALRRGRDQDQAYVNHILTCLGQTGSTRVLPVLIQALRDDELKSAALLGLLMVAGQHKREVYDAAKQIRDRVIKLFVRAMLGDDPREISAFAGKLQSRNSEERNLALRLAAILAHPELEDTLDRVRKTDKGNEIEKFTSRYLATKASFAVLTRGSNV